MSEKIHGNSIIDEYTFRDDLSYSQKYYKRNKDKVKARAKEKKAWRSSRPCRKEEQAKARDVWASKSFEEKAEYHYKKKYNLTYKEVEDKLKTQDMRCVCCGLELSMSGDNRCVVDHCHSTNKIRELLCNHCNKVLGLVYEKKETLMNMFKYLEKWNG